MRLKIFTTILLLLVLLPFFPIHATESSIIKRVAGRILLQVESRGEAWYIEPKTGERYYMANGDKAYNAMRNFGVGITNNNLEKIKSDKNLAKKSSGKIFLQVESRGEAYYIDFNGNSHYLKDGAAAYEIMRSLGLGITNKDLANIQIHNTPTPAITNNTSPTLTAQAKILINDNINEFNKTIKNCDEFSGLIYTRIPSLTLKISDNKEISDILSTMTSAAAPSLIDFVSAITKEYTNEITTMEEYEKNLVKSKEIFSTQRNKFIGLNNLLDPSKEIDLATYQKISEAIDKDKSLYSNTSVSINTSLQNFKSSAIAKDEQYKAWWGKFNAVVDTIKKNLALPGAPQQTNIKCYVNTNFNGSVSSIDCY